MAEKNTCETEKDNGVNTAISLLQEYGDDVLVINSPSCAHQIKKVFLNGVEIPPDGITDITFTAPACELCCLTVSRTPARSDNIFMGRINV